LDIYSNDEIEIPVVDEEVLRIINSLSKIKSLKVTQQELITVIQSEISQIEDFNKLFLEISSVKRPAKWIPEFKATISPENDTERKKMLSFLLLNRILFRILNSVDITDSKTKLFNELLLWKPLSEIYGSLRYDDPGQSYELCKILFDSEFEFTGNTDRYFLNIFEKDLIISFVQINEYENVKYFNKERIEELVKWQFIISCFNLISQSTIKGKLSKKAFIDSFKITFENYSLVIQRIFNSEYKVENLLSIQELKIIKKTKSTKKVLVKKVTPKKNTVSKVKSKEVKKKTEKTVNKGKKKVTTKKPKTKKKAKP
jgi:hypothetical protein